jgi:putative membrane protein
VYEWSFDPLQVGAIAALGGLYAIRLLRLRRRGTRVPARKPALMALALLALLAALVSPIDALGEERLFSVHMVQHLLIGDVAPLFVVLAISGPLVRPVLALPFAMRLQGLAHPAVALAVWVGNLALWHVPAAYDAALANPVLHAAEHASFFVAGLLLWVALLEPIAWPRRMGYGGRLGVLAAAWVAASILSNVFLWGDRVDYAPYASAPRTWGLSALADQRLGGGIMLLEMSVVMLAVGVWLALAWLREAERRQRLVDAGAPPEVAVRVARRGQR